MANPRLSMRDPSYNPKALQQDTFQDGSGVYRTSKDGSATLVSGSGAPTLPPPQQQQTTIPVSIIDTPPLPPQPLTISSAAPVNQTVAAAQSLLTSYKSEQDASLKAEQDKNSGSESLVRAYMNELTGKSAFQAQQEDAYDVTGKKDRYNQLINRISLKTDEIYNDDDASFFREMGLEDDAASRDVTKNVFNAQASRVRRERAIDRTAQAAELRTLLAGAALQQGDIALAQEQVTRAVSAKYDPIAEALENEKFFLERSDTRLTEAQRAVSEARKSQLDYELGVLESAQAAIVAATPYASQEELMQMTKLDPQQAQLLAQSITGRVAQEDRALDRAAKQASINASNISAQKAQMEIAAQQADLANGVLSEAQIKAVDNSPQGKKVKSLGELKAKLSNYQTLVDQYGTSSFGSQKATLDAAFADLKIAYKTAAELGALQGPDIALLEEALRPASFANPLTQGFAKLTGNGIGAINASLTEAQNVINQAAGTNIMQLYARNGSYRNSEYVSSLIDPLLTTVSDVSQIDSAAAGQIIRMPDGLLLQKQQDGTFKEI
jgi:hypothetical protein